MSIEKQHIIYTEADIRRYLSGGMNHAEMYVIEKAALDDPFLAEAIEGYEAMEQKDWNEDLLILKKRLEVVENTPVVPIYKTSFTKWWKAAAAVLVIGSTVAVAYMITSRQPVKNIVLAEAKKTSDSSRVAGTETSGQPGRSDSIVPVSIAVNSNTASAATTIIAADSTWQILLADVSATKKPADEFEYSPAPVASDEKKEMAAKRYETDDSNKMYAGAVAVNQSNNNDANTQLNERSLSDKDSRSQNSNAAESYKFKNNPSNNYFNAQVVTADNKPIPYANVKVTENKNSKPVYTDTKGNFGLTAADSTISVVVTSAGYTPQKYTLQNSAAQNKIVLQPADIATKQITVARKKGEEKAKLNKEAENEEMDEEDAEPFGGWVEYNNYLSNNLVFPNEAREKNIHGEVELYVKLNSKGEIAKVKVDKTLCPECDAEAIRLVKDGPKWDTKKNKASGAKVKIKF